MLEVVSRLDHNLALVEFVNINIHFEQDFPLILTLTIIIIFSLLMIILNIWILIFISFWYCGVYIVGVRI